MRRSILIGGTMAAFGVGVVGWAWLSIHKSRSAPATPSILHVSQTRSSSGPCDHVIELETTAPLHPIVSETEDTVGHPPLVEVIDLTELQRIPQKPMETDEPPLAEVLPAVFQENSASAIQSVTRAVCSGASHQFAPRLKDQQIPADFLLHSADGPASSKRK